MSKRCYVDNAYNRSVGRVGQPVGSHVVSRSSSGGGGSQSTCSSSSSVYVSGYTRSDGTYMAPYTRSSPGRSSSSRSTSTVSNSTVYVSGYTRSDGTYVAPYTRSSPGGRSGSSRSTSTMSNSTDTDVVHGKGCTRSDGTVVKPHTRSKPSSTKSKASSTETISSTKSNESAGSPRVYVDNAYNRKLGRVGKAIGTHVVSRTTTDKSDAVCYYVNNSYNRRLGRAGKPIPKRGKRPKEIIEKYGPKDLEDILKGLVIVDGSPPDYQYGCDYLRQREVEESWSRSGIELSTNIPYLDTFISQNASCFKVIPYKELELNQEIGRGGFGVVVAGLWHNTPIAFKKLYYSRMSRKRLDSFLNEVTILASLNHPHTVKLFGAVADTDNNCVGIIMEYLCRSLFKAIFIDESGFTDDKKKEIISQTADALVYFHDDRKIAHCDIKSENILLDSNDVVKIGDFGLSTMKNITETTQSVPRAGQGTPRYSAPEVLRGDLLSKSQLFPTDIYSLAIVVFEVIVEEEPFDGLNLKQLERHVGNGDLRPISENTAINLSVKVLLDRCWDAEALSRPKAKEFQEKWKHLRALAEPLILSQ